MTYPNSDPVQPPVSARQPTNPLNANVSASYTNAIQRVATEQVNTPGTSSSGGISPLAPPTQLPASNHPAVRAVRSAQAAPTGLEPGAHAVSDRGRGHARSATGDVRSQLQFGAAWPTRAARYQPFAPKACRGQPPGLPRPSRTSRTLPHLRASPGRTSRRQWPASRAP